MADDSPAVLDTAVSNPYMAYPRDAIIAERKQAQAMLDSIIERIQPIRDDIAGMDLAIAQKALNEMKALGQKGDYVKIQDPDGEFEIEIDNKPIVKGPDKFILEEILNITSLADNEQRIKAIRRIEIPEEVIPAHEEVIIQGNSLAKLARENLEVAAIVKRAYFTVPRTRPIVKWTPLQKRVTE